MNIMVALVHVVERMNPYRCSISRINFRIEFRVNSCKIIVMCRYHLFHLIEKRLMQLKYILQNKSFKCHCEVEP